MKPVLADPAAVSKILAYHAVKGARIEPSYFGKGVEVLPTLLPGQTLRLAKVVSPKAEGNVGVVTLTADSANARPVHVRKHNIIAGASYINSELCRRAIVAWIGGLQPSRGGWASDAALLAISSDPHASHPHIDPPDTPQLQ